MGYGEVNSVKKIVSCSKFFKFITVPEFDYKSIFQTKIRIINWGRPQIYGAFVNSSEKNKVLAGVSISYPLSKSVLILENCIQESCQDF